MKVRFNPQNRQAGTISFLNWKNDDLLAALRKAFRESPKEKIVGIDITPKGIRAHFERR